MDVDSFSPRLLFGITGHRDIDNRDKIRSIIRDEITSIQQRVSENTDNKPIPALLSPLAEGADRLAADATLDCENGELHAVLPLPPDDYKKTFSNNSARKELNSYINHALTTTVQPDREDTPGVFLDVGKSIVDTCDVLFAIWDGNSAKGKGGTGDIVKYARRHQTPLVWINPANLDEPIYENLNGFSLAHDQDITEFNQLSTDAENSQVYCRNKLEKLRDIEDIGTENLTDIDYVHSKFEEIFRIHCPLFYKADRASLNYQTRFKYASLIIYLLAAFAVGVISIQILFFSERPEIVLLESVAMVGILLIVYLGGRERWHENWLKYRTLAEKVRSRWFVGLSTQCTTDYIGPSPVHGSQLSSRWITDILIETWKRRSDEGESTDASVKTVKAFLRTHWLEDQIEYHQNNRDSSRRKNSILSITSYSIFLITLVASIVHGTELTGHSFTSSIVFVSLFLPAVGGAISAIRMSRDYETEALRSERILQLLHELDYQLDYISDCDSLVEWSREVEKILEIEHHNWRNIHEGKPLEPAS